MSDWGLLKSQLWLQQFITAPNLDEQLAAIAPTVVTSLERANIYRNMYLSRLGEALETDYPGVLHAMGREGFDAMVAGYLEAFPSTSYTLNRLSDNLPDYLAKRPDLLRRKFLVDLARLELAIVQVFDEAESPPLAPEQIGAIAPEAWERARLQPVAAFRLLEFQYPVSAYLAAVDSNGRFPFILPRKTWVVVYRHEYRVLRLDLTRKGFVLLNALAAGSPLATAVEQAGVGERQLFEWFRQWTAEGLFQAVVLP